MEALVMFALMVFQPPDVFGGEYTSARVPCGAESFKRIDLDAINVPLKADVPPILVAAAQPPCPNGNCPTPVRRVARAAAAPARVVARQAKVAAAPKSLVEIHNDLHNGFEGGPNWTWPGDLAEHLRTAHGVDLTAQQAGQPTPAVPVAQQSSSCPGGVCPTASQARRPVRSVLRRITRRR